MKLSIDTTNKTIQVEGQVNLLEFTEALERMFPKGLWKTFKLLTQTTIVWSNPVTIYPSYPYYPWWTTTTPVLTTTGTYTLTGEEQTSWTLASGVYNVEI